MKLVKSKQSKIKFIVIKSPITIDKSKDWGPGNFQNFPNGAFLKVEGEEISHGVQPEDDFSNPIGWIPNKEAGFFDKKPIWISDDTFEEGMISLSTKDGHIHYEVNEPCKVCYNNLNNKADLTDAWVQTIDSLQKNYILE